jgi:hypothetical protein
MPDGRRSPNPEIHKELETGRFQVLGLYVDLWGNPFVEGSEWIGIVAEKNDP